MFGEEYQARNDNAGAGQPIKPNLGEETKK
jgi:hypothetical protein